MSRTQLLRNYFISCLLVATTGNASASEAAEKQTTPDGHQYWYLLMPDAERNAVAVTWHTDLPGSVHPAAAIVGIDLMLNGGAGGKGPEEIIADFEDLDAGSRLWVQPREITGFMVAPEQHLDKAADIANEVLVKPNLDQKWFDREHARLLENVAEDKNSIWAQAWNLSHELMLGQHSYNKFWSISPQKEIKSIALTDIKDWHSKAFTTSAVTIGAAGNASADKFAKQIDRMFKGMPDHKPAEFAAFSGPTMSPTTILLHQPGADKSALLVIGSLDSMPVEHALSIKLGVGVLGHGKQSRLFKAIRSGLRASYDFGAEQFEFTRQHRLFHMSGEIETDKLQDALQIVEDTYQEFKLKGIGRLEFPIAKTFYKREMNKQLQRPASVAFMLMDAQKDQKGLDHVSTLSDQVSALERGAVNDLIRDIMPPFDQLLKIIVTADKNAIEDVCVITDISDWKSCI